MAPEAAAGYNVKAYSMRLAAAGGRRPSGRYRAL
jgi:hypothetical protein